MCQGDGRFVVVGATLPIEEVVAQVAERERVGYVLGHVERALFVYEYAAGVKEVYDAGSSGFGQGGGAGCGGWVGLSL
jgi:hypothetical protein